MELKGKYGNAEIHTEDVDEKTASQVLDLLNTPNAQNAYIKIMPDCHAGAGCVIGTTMKITNKVCPNLVGVDIGCGMNVEVLKLSIKDIDFKKLDKVCHDIPSGFNVWNCNKNYVEDNLFSFKLENLYCFKYLHDIERIKNSLGTLGGGNHFIELDREEDTGNIYLVIHSGSRNLGVQVASYYQNLAISNCKKEDNKEIIDKLKLEHREKEIQYELSKVNNNNNISKELCYLIGKDMEDYLHDMFLVQKFAEWNRQLICNYIIENMNWNAKKSYGFQTIHNYIDQDDMILRKGAINAKKDKLCIIPMNMKDGSLICNGLGNPKWNYSAPHGAGRIMSRTKAKELLKLEDYEKSMKGIYSTTINKGTIDESVYAYKPISEIIKCINGKCVDIISIIKPIYNFKAEEQIPLWKKGKEE